jgi:uncharacterized protein YciI
MKGIVCTCISILFFLLLTIDNNIQAQTNPDYDSVLAKKYNADDYGMKQYVLVLLKTGTANITDKGTLDSIFRGHMANIQRLAAENKLITAGPLSENDKNYEGIFVFNTNSLDEAREWVNTDPAIRSKELDAELYVWYGPASLPAATEMYNKVRKKNF